MKTALLAAAVSAIIAGVAIAQSTEAPPTAATTLPAVEASAFKPSQAEGEWRIANYVGKPIVNATGEKIGDINDVLFDRSGKITTVVIGVGGFLGLGEKRVALPFEAITYSEEDGKRLIMVPLTKETLQEAPEFKLIEKTTMDKVREAASEVATKATEKASEIKDQAVQTIEEYRAEDAQASTGNKN